MTVKPDDLILLSHGGGGHQTSALINTIILTTFRNPILEKLDDGAILQLPTSEIVMSTDSYVITPLFFPGGNIGTLAACGTINDLIMQGSQPLYLSLGLILEEGFPVKNLQRILQSIADIINPIGVKIVTGDTKVVERGTGHGLFINTTGIGCQTGYPAVPASNAQPGDHIILTGTMGDHGLAIMCQREGLKMTSPIESDVACLWPMLSDLFNQHVPIHVLRDPTRGGVAAALNDIATQSNCGINLIEQRLPVKKEVAAAANLLGLDVLTIANEGKALIICPPTVSESMVTHLHRHDLGKEAVVIGRVVSDHPGQVVLETTLGGQRLVDMPGGELLPRIC